MMNTRGTAFRLAAAAGLLILVFSAAATAHAQIVPKECRSSESDVAKSCTLCHIAVMAINFTNFLMKNIAFPAAVLLITIGGLTLLTAGPSEGRRTTGKKILTTTIVGLIIIMLAWLAVDTIIKVLTGGKDTLIQTFGPWNTINPSNCPL